MKDFDAEHPHGSMPDEPPTGGATGIFGTHGQKTDISSATEDEAPAVNVVVPNVHEVTFQPNESGDLDPLKRVLSSNPPVMTDAARSGVASGADSMGFTQLLSTLGSQSPAPPGSSAAPTRDPGNFTRMFEALEGQSTSAVPSAASPVSPPASHSFTQLFQALDVKPEQPAPANPASASTQVFRTPLPDREGSATSSAGENPGTFTQFFATVPSQRQQGESQADAFPPLPSAASSTKPYSAPPKDIPGPYATGASAAVHGEKPRGSLGGTPSSASLTQLLQKLETPNPISPEGDATSVVTPSVPPNIGQERLPTGQQPGTSRQPGGDAGATTVFRVSAEPPLSPQSSSAGPGDFTRVIQSSASREGQAIKEDPSSVSPSATSAPQNPATLPRWSMPHTPQMPHVPGGSGLPAPHLPTSPLEPKVLKPPVQPADIHGAAKYLPILLIIIIVLLVAILLAVVLTMKH